MVLLFSQSSFPLTPSAPAWQSGPIMSEENCAICYEALSTAHTETLIGCGHIFHSSCIVPALQHNRSCPLCRFQPTLPDPDYGFSSSESDESSEGDQAQTIEERRALRRRAVMSSLARVRHGSATARVTADARQYSALRDRLEAARALLSGQKRALSQRARTHRSTMQRQFFVICREHTRLTRTLRRDVSMTEATIRRLEQKREALTERLARAAGFEVA